jgi:DNA-binding NarL/FixJ family response regulator
MERFRDNPQAPKQGIIQSDARADSCYEQSMASTHVQVALVEDHPLMQEVLASLVQQTPDLHVCAIAGSAEYALTLAAVLAADVVLVDVSLPGMNGIQLVRRLCAIRPGIRCLMISTHRHKSYSDGALAAGARGYLQKGNLSELLGTIRSVQAGALYLSEPAPD